MQRAQGVFGNFQVGIMIKNILLTVYVAGNFRFIPKIDFFIDPEGGNVHGFFTLGLVGYWELPLDKPQPQQPNDPNVAAPPPAY